MLRQRKDLCQAPAHGIRASLRTLDAVWSPAKLADCLGFCLAAHLKEFVWSADGGSAANFRRRRCLILSDHLIPHHRSAQSTTAPPHCGSHLLDAASQASTAWCNSVLQPSTMPTLGCARNVTPLGSDQIFPRSRTAYKVNRSCLTYLPFCFIQSLTS